jgi:carbon-monoxide dehydrogenase large subunit
MRSTPTHVPVDAYRGAGRPEATFVVERMMEVAAREMGMDPATFRKRNFVKSFPHQTPVIMLYDTGDYDAHLKAAMEAIDYAKGFGKRKREAARQAARCAASDFPATSKRAALPRRRQSDRWGPVSALWESAEVRVNPTGNVEVLTGSHSHGQGHETVFAQLVTSGWGSLSTRCPSCMAIPTRCSSAWAPMARARALWA